MCHMGAAIASGMKSHGDAAMLLFQLRTCKEAL